MNSPSTALQTTRMSAENSVLLQKLGELLSALMRQDAAAAASAAKLKAAAKRGDKAAQHAWNTLSALYWRRNSPTWRKAEAFYAKIIAKDPPSCKRFEAILSLSKNPSGDAADCAKKAMAMLKAIHNHRKASVWYPGAPKTGYYPMPHSHRPGIVIGGPFDSLLPPGLVPPGLVPPGLGVPGGFSIPGGQLPIPIPGGGSFPIPGGGVLPVPPGGIPGLGQIPGLGGGFPSPGGFQIPGGFLNSPEGRMLGNFLPLTTQSATGLLSMIAQARQSPGRSGVAPGRSSFDDDLQTGPGGGGLDFEFPSFNATPEQLQAAEKGRQIIATRAPFATYRAKIAHAPDGAFGYDFAIGVVEGMALPGPGQDRAKASLPSGAAQAAFGIGQAHQHAWTKTQAALQPILPKSFSPTATQLQFAAKGRQIISTRPSFADYRFKIRENRDGAFGYDVGVGVSEGMKTSGPGQERECAAMPSNTSRATCGVGQAHQHAWSNSH